MDERTDFGDRQPLPGHCAVRLDVPANLPAKFHRPTQYILTAVRANHEIMHAFCHERCMVLIVPDEATANRVRQFTADLLDTMTQTTKTFRLRVEGIAALSRPLVTELVSRLGELIELNMNGTTTDNYADTASIVVRQNADWRCPKTLPFRAYGFDLQAELSVAPASAERLPGEAPWQNAPGRNQRVAKVQPCFDFKRGACSRGDTCKFRHVAPARAPNVCVSPGCPGDCGRRHVTKATSIACRDFGRGRCTRGQCKFVHAPSVAAQTQAASAPPAAGHPASLGSDDRSGAVRSPSAAAPADTTCRDFLRNRCRRERCRFAHPNVPHVPSAASLPSSANGENGVDGKAPPTSISLDSPAPNAVSDSGSDTEQAARGVATSPTPARGRKRRQRRRGASSDDDSDSRSDSHTGSPRHSRTRSRSWPADEAPSPNSSRSAWMKPLKLTLPDAPTPVLGRKRPLSQTPPPPSATSPTTTPLLAAREPQQQHAAPLAGAVPQAP